MSVLFMDGFEEDDVSLKWPGYAPSTSATTRFSSGKSVDLNGLVMKKSIPATTQIFVGFAVMWDTFAPWGLTLFGDNGGTTHLQVRLNSFDVTVYVGNTGTVLATAGSIFNTNSWYYVEVMSTVAAAGGTAIVKVDGVTKINFTGNTKTSGTNNTTDYIGIGSSGANHFFDDLYVCDANGATNNTFLGDIRVQTLMPTGTGSSTQFTSTGSVNNWQNVSEIPDVTTTFNASSTVGQRDTYAMADLNAATGTVFAVQDNTHAFKSSVGAGNLKAALKSGATVAYDAVQFLGPANAWTGTVRETDPNTGLAWTVGGVNAAELGGEVA